MVRPKIWLRTPSGGAIQLRLTTLVNLSGGNKRRAEADAPGAPRAAKRWRGVVARVAVVDGAVTLQLTCLHFAPLGLVGKRSAGLAAAAGTPM